MYANEYSTQLDFFFDDGSHQTFSIPDEPAVFYQQLQAASEGKWLVLHLYDRSVTIRIDSIVRIEVMPNFVDIQGDGILPEVQEVTSMTRAARR